MAGIDPLTRIAGVAGGRHALKRLAREVRWMGNAVRCVCCGWRGRAFRPSCHDRPGVPLLCARCMSGPADRALVIALRSITSALPAGARVLDVEARQYTRRWFGRFNQFDYRTLSATDRDADFPADVAAVNIPTGMCHLIVLSQGVGRDHDVMEIALALRRLTVAGGSVLIGTPPDARTDAAVQLRHVLQEVGFVVTVDAVAERVEPTVARRHGLLDADAVLICTTSEAGRDPQVGHLHHHGPTGG